MQQNLVGGLNPSEKYELVNWDDDIPNIWVNKKCSKPPTRNVIQTMIFLSFQANIRGKSGSGLQVGGANWIQ